MVILFVIVTIVSYISIGVLMESFTLVVSFILLSLFLFLKRLNFERRSKENISNMFSKYISEDVVKQLIRT